jgi:hypothetical protein
MGIMAKVKGIKRVMAIAPVKPGMAAKIIPTSVASARVMKFAGVNTEIKEEII